MMRVSDMLVTLTSFDNEGSVEDKPEEYMVMNSSSQVNRYNVMYTLWTFPSFDQHVRLMLCHISHIRRKINILYMYLFFNNHGLTDLDVKPKTYTVVPISLT